MQDRFKFRTYIPDLKFFKYWGWIEENHYIGLCPSGDYSMAELLEKYTDQCTGFKDKNGKLIYEGDIVSDKSNHIRVVVWEQDCFKYPALKTSRYFHRPISNQLEERKIGLRGKLTFQDAIGKCDKKHFEVIGNIYENPELLED